MHSESAAKLPISEPERTSEYRCPGESLPISKAVHLGRLASGWHGCAECAWRTDSDGVSATSTGVKIRRTEFGVRGAYLNSIDRFRGAQLASIFSMHLASVHSEALRLRERQQGPAEHQTLTDAASSITVAAGYDEHHGAADVFSGVVSAVLQNGCNVVDAGRCTAASLLHVSHRVPHLCGSLLVTGAGGVSGDIGLDMFDTHGQGVAIPWQKFGVSTRLRNHGTTAGTSALDDKLLSLRSGRDITTAAVSTGGNVSSDTVLQLPPLHESGGRVFRGSRRSGVLSTVPAEQHYQDWLLRWWPVQSRQLVRCFVENTQTRQRLEWLTKQCLLNLDIQRTSAHGGSRIARESQIRSGNADRLGSPELHEISSGVRLPSADRAIELVLGDDDRFLGVRSRRGREIPVDEMAAWINRCVPSFMSHLTAHGSPCGQRILLVDVAAPNTGQQHQVISDGLALAGLILTCAADDANPLPI